jgi:cytochrome c553
MSKITLFLSTISFAFLISCGKDDSSTSTVDCAGVTPTYKTDIAAILNSSCAQSGCHSAASKADGFDLSTYAASKSATGSSSFLKSIKHESGVDKMPQGASKLSDATIKKIECWIVNGTPE